MEVLVLTRKSSSKHLDVPKELDKRNNSSFSSNCYPFIQVRPLIFGEIFTLKERIAIVSWKLGGKTYEKVRQLSVRKQPPASSY
ncbi:hypothetical protein TNCT_547271 [Trichonephila clavata]|uniref:Uncharacterized protein n=1 Tax=Trichonephila clavata TaxID=2740835 RepID=A0A8X6KVU8_TRICU|nr:hypothetical protein TNCT_547271 [Trichonephila clavata]